MQASKKMVLAGVMAPGSLSVDTLDKLLLDPSVLLLSETTSNIWHERSIPAIDQLIAPMEEEEFEQLAPDMLVTIGGMVVSKKIKAFLRKHPPKVHIHIDPKKAYDTYFVLDRHIKATPEQFFSAISSEHLSTQSNYQSTWLDIRDRRRLGHEDYLEKIPFSDFLVHHTIYSTISLDYNLQLSNSTAIRYSQLFNLSHVKSVYCNRGTSGIDGSNSTAIGMAMVGDSPVVLVTGDLSFFYDSNAFWNDHLPSSFRVILLNNSGGGIFRILPGAKETSGFDKFFETQHKLTAKSLCDMYQMDHLLVDNTEDLEKALEGFYQDSGRARVLEVDTSGCANDEILLNYFDHIR